MRISDHHDDHNTGWQTNRKKDTGKQKDFYPQADVWSRNNNWSSQGHSAVNQMQRLEFEDRALCVWISLPWPYKDNVEVKVRKNKALCGGGGKDNFMPGKTSLSVDARLCLGWRWVTFTLLLLRFDKQTNKQTKWEEKSHMYVKYENLTS